MVAGDGNTTGAGGAIAITAGSVSDPGNPAGTGGAVTISAGNSEGDAGDGGAVTINGGDAIGDSGAGGTIILTESGGKFTDFRGKNNDIFYNEFVYTNGLIHKELLKILND